MMTDEQGRWTIAIVMMIGGMFGLYTTLMVGYFTDSLPRTISPMFLLSGATPMYFAMLALLELCWFVRWRALA